jgi:tripartite ATP-independent transporter DctP family solute receptor
VKTMLKKFRCLFLVLVLILVVVSCCTVFAAKKPIKLAFGVPYAADHYCSKYDLMFKDLVEKQTKGQILVDFYPALQLGTVPEELQAIKMGAQQMFATSPGNIVTYLPRLATFDLPYIYRDQDHHIKVAKKFATLVGQDELVAKLGARVLGYYIDAPRHLTTNVPVNKFEDVKGIKIRLPEHPTSLALWKAFGAIPIVLPLTDVYTALATGTVNAQENPFVYIQTMRFYEVQKYCALTAHKREVGIILINDKCWKSLTKKQQKILTNVSNKCGQLKIQAAVDSNEALAKTLAKEGMQFTKPDLAPFREKAKTIWSQFGDSKLIKKIEAIK